MSRSYLPQRISIVTCFFMASLHAAQEPLSTQQDSPPLISIEQTGEPVPQPFNIVPVTIRITNNNDHNLWVDLPYFSNLTFLNADHTKDPVDVLVYGTGETVKNMATVAGGVLVGGVATFWLMEKSIRGAASPIITHLTIEGIPTLEQIAKFAITLGIAVGSISEVCTLLRTIKADSEYLIKPHETLILEGHISVPEMEQIRDGNLKPEIIVHE